ncbi:MAG TPA: TolC family protein, partial [Bauldia sp.]|nr:TolC family protein [Bauldia sp.]
MFDGRGVWAAAFGALALALAGSPAAAETMAAALGSAYTDNPDLNSARAQLRAIDEGVPKALSGYRPQISATADISEQTTRSSISPEWSKGLSPRGYSISVEQPIFLGFRTTNGVKMAQSSVKAARQQLKVVEAEVLLDAVTAFMDVIRAQVVVNLTAQNIEFLREQLRAAEDRLTVGEGTRTDVAQTNARLQEGISDYAQAVADLNRAIATYIQVIGHRPERLGGYNGIEKLLPHSVDAGLAVALSEHPSIVAALYNVDIASYNVKIAEGALLPTAGVQAQFNRRENQTFEGQWNETASITGRVSIPIYQGGEAAAEVREFKETLSQRR